MSRSLPKQPPNAEPSDEPREILAAEAAKRLGLTKQAIGVWCVKPGAPMRKSGTRVYLRWPEFARWREQLLVDGAKKETTAGSFGERRSAAEARNAEIAMERNELALAKERGEAVAVADYEAALGVVLDRLTARLRGLPVRLSHFGAAVEAATEAEVERTIVELHAFDEDVLEEDDQQPGQEAA